MTMNSFLTRKTILLCLIFIATTTSGYSAIRAISEIRVPINLIFTADTLCRMQAGSVPKYGQLEEIVKDIREPLNIVKAVVIAGNLTFDGSDTAFDLFSRVYINEIIHLLPELPHGGLYLCKGDSDELSGQNTELLKYLKKEYGNFRYTFDIDDLHLICCGKFPSTDHHLCETSTMRWLQKDLQNVGKERPVIIFFSYNIMGPFSNNWPKPRKDELFDLVKDYNVKCIFFGQMPYSFSMLWRDKIRVAGVGGNGYAFCTYNPMKEADEDFEIVLKDATGSQIDDDKDGVTSGFKDL